MIYGIGILAVVAVLFFLGVLKNISIYFKNDILALIIILFTIALNVLPPFNIGRIKIFFGGCFLYLMLIALIFLSKKYKDLTYSLLAIIFGGSLLIAFRVFLIDTIFMAEWIRVLALITMGAIVSFVIGRDPLSIFSTAYMGYFISEILAFFLLENHTMLLGGGMIFTIMTASGVVGVALYIITARVPKEARVKNIFSFKGEASKEFDSELSKKFKNGK